jgi:hypothetical protein
LIEEKVVAGMSIINAGGVEEAEADDARGDITTDLPRSAGT